MLQGIKNAIPETQQHVGIMYSLSNIYRVASLHNGLMTVLEYMCHTSIQRVVAEPPLVLAQDLRHMLDILYGFSAEHH